MNTRSKTGHTPRKPQNPGFVETPGRGLRSRKSLAAEDGLSQATLVEINTSAKANGSSVEDRSASNGASKRTRSIKSTSSEKDAQDPKIDDSGEFEFGGSIGVACMMIGFPTLMWYMWIGATYYNGKFPTRTSGQTYPAFFEEMGHLVYTGAYPSPKAWVMYWSFLIFEAGCYLYMPGIYSEGKPLEHEGGKTRKYYCSGVWSFYSTIAIALTLHFTGLFKLYTLIDEFGPLLSVAIISGFLVSIIAYASALYRGAVHRMTGFPIYDFFMGAELNPRMFEWLDFKMFFEVRIPWFILFLLTLGACARQYEQYGYISGELGFMLMAHWLYANACAKGEELIPPTWDIYYEKWGFMLIFWNLAGVPLSYCHGTIYLANHDPATYRWPRWFLAILFACYLCAYYVWDTAASQKNIFRANQRGNVPARKSFPQLPWRAIENPETVPFEGGEPLFADGWYKYARKIHYTCDMWFSFNWGLITGFGSPFPWFYPLFFAVMITHRASRDLQKCRARYGDAWREFEKRCPHLFIPGVW